MIIHIENTLIPQLSFVHLKGEQRKDHEAENSQRHDLC